MKGRDPRAPRHVAPERVRRPPQAVRSEPPVRVLSRQQPLPGKREVMSRFRPEPDTGFSLRVVTVRMVLVNRHDRRSRVDQRRTGLERSKQHPAVYCGASFDEGGKGTPERFRKQEKVTCRHVAHQWPDGGTPHARLPLWIIEVYRCRMGEAVASGDHAKSLETSRHPRERGHHVIAQQRVCRDREQERVLCPLLGQLDNRVGEGRAEFVDPNLRYVLDAELGARRGRTELVANQQHLWTRPQTCPGRDGVALDGIEFTGERLRRREARQHQGIFRNTVVNRASPHTYASLTRTRWRSRKRS